MTTVLQAIAFALLPTLAWGYFFVSRNPESRRLVVVTFVMGTLAIVPLLLFMDQLGIQLRHHHVAAGPATGMPGQALGVFAFFLVTAGVMFGLARLFYLVSRRIARHGLRIGALVAVALLLVLATLSYDQLHRYLGPIGGQLTDLFHFLVIFSLAMYVLDKLSSRAALNIVVAGVVALGVLVLLDPGERLAAGSGTDLGSISTVFSLPFLLGIANEGPLTLRLLDFLQLYLLFAVIAISSLLVVALVHVVYLLHERTWVKVVHGLSLAFFSLPFLARAIATINPALSPAILLPAAPAAVVVAWYANLVLLAGLSAWSLYQLGREDGGRRLGLFTALYEEPLNFLGVGLALTAFVAVCNALGLPLVASSIIFLAFGEEYSKHLVVRFTDDESIRSVDDAIEFSVIVGLAFAFAENVLWYFPRFLSEQNMTVVLLRSTLTVLMHGVASGLFGYFYGMAHFATEEVRDRHAARGTLYRLLHRLFLFRRERLYHEVKMLEGLMVAGTFHAVYNLAVSEGRVGVVVALVGCGSALLYYLLGRKANRIRLGEIAATRVRPPGIQRLRG